MARIVSDKEARKLKINLQTDSGEQFGQVSVSAHNAITGGYLDKYTPVDDAEKKVIDAYKSKLQTKTPTYQERKVERSSRIKEIDAEIGAIKDTNAHNNYTSATRNLAVARRSVGVVGRKQIKSLEEKQKAAKKKYTKATADLETLSAEKLQIESTQKMDDVAEKYKIDPENFSYGDFKKWADNHNHNFSINSNGGAVITPKKTATVQEKEEAKILEAIAFDVANRKAAVEAPVLSSAITVAGAPVRGVMGAISTIEDNINVARGKEIDLFSVSKRPARMTSTIRGTVDEEYASKWFGGKELPVIGNVGSMLYNTGMSIGDNAVNMAVGSVFGKALSLSGVSSAATNKAVSYLTSGLMASDATTMAIISNKERGLSDEAALAQGLATGLIELVTEKWSIEKIISEPKTVLSGVLKSMGAEGSEEMTSEVLNKTIDILANKDKSHLQVTIKQYIEDGYTEKEAVTKAWGDMFADVISSGVSGMLSGGVMSGVHQGITNSSRRNEITKTNDVIKTINQIAGKEIIKPLSNNASEEAIYQKQNEIGTQNFSDLQSIALPGVLGENGQKAFSSNFREGQNEADYTMGFRRMYNLGQSNISLEKASAEIKGNKYIQSLSPDQRMAAYYSGQNDAKAQLEAERDSVKYVEFYSDDAGVVENDAAKRVDAEELKAIDRLARTVGAQVVFEEEIEGFNGYVELGKIHISLNAENKLAVVAAHEVTHRMQELAPESYRKYRDFVMASVGVEVVESYQKKLNEKDIYLSDSEVMDEIAADYTKKILADPQSMQKFVDDALNGKLDTNASIAENRTILERLFDSIKEFIKKVSEKFSGRKAEQNQAARDAYGVDLETLKQAKNLLQKALKDSADVVTNKDNNVHLSERDARKETEEKRRDSVKMRDDTTKTQKDENIPYDYTKSFAEQIEDYKVNKFPKNDTFLVCATTEILKKIGLNALPITMNQEHVDYILNNTKDEDHYLGEDFLKKLPELLEAPLAVIEDFGHNNRLTVLVQYTHPSNGKQSIVPIEVDGYGTINDVSIDSNAIVTAFAKGGILDTLGDVVAKGGNGLYYWNKKEALTLLQTLGRQLPNHLPQDGFVNSIRKKDSKVKPRIENVTETQQFIRFFGDWIKNPKRASKIVNVDGTPKIVYHQTAEDFDIFSTKVEKAGKYDSETPIGHFFKSTSEDIGLDGKRQMAVYLNMRRPLRLYDRTALSDYWSKNVEGYKNYLDELNNLQKEYEYKISQVEAMEDADYQALWEKLQAGKITDAEYEKGIEVDDSDMLLREWEKKDNEIRRKMKKTITEFMSKSNYDGVIIKEDTGSNGKKVETYIVFESTQIKSATDNVGTFDKNNPNKRYSIKMDEDLLKQNEQLKKVNLLLNKKLHQMKNEKQGFRKEKVATVTKKILKDFDFAYDAEMLSRQMEGLAEDTKQIIAGNMDLETFKHKVFDVAKDVVEAGTRSDSLAYTESKAMRDYLRTTKITLSEDARNNLGDEYETIRKSTFGRLRLVKEGGTPIDVAYQELSELYPEYFSTETETNASAQLRQIQSVLDGLQSLKSDAFGGYTDEAAEWLSSLMIDQIYNEVFVSGDGGKANVSVDIKAMRTEMADNMQKIMNRERGWREREYNKLQKQFEKKTRNYTESRQKAVKIKQIKLHTERLSKALINPSERFAVPEDLKKPVAEFLSCINLENDRLGEKTRETLGDLMSTYRQIAEQEYELGMVLDPQLIYNIEDISEAVKKMDIKEKRISDLDLVTMEKLRTSIMSMETMLRNYNQTFRDGKKEQIDILAAKACEEIKERIKGIKKNSKIGAVKGFSDMLNFDMLNPWDYFHQMGGTFEELFGGLREGENRQIRNLAKSKAYLEEMTEKYGVSKKDMTDKSLKTFNLANGESLELTKAQVMSLYLLWRQNQTHEHITEGGIRPGKVTQKLIESKDGESKVKMSVSEDYNAVRPVLDDIAVILDTLSDNEKKFAESISDFFVDECADWGNEVALKLYGYKKFNTPNYFPIVSDKMYLQEDFGVSADATIKNMGITKRRIKHANNPIIIEDIFDVYARHVSDMAKYNAYVLPLQDVQRVFNSRSFDGNNNVKALVATKFGKQAVDYFSKFMVDINMGINNQYGNALSSNLISKYKQAKMGLNARVVVQQPMSYVRAAALIDAKYLAGAMGKKVDIETVFKYSPIAQWKSWGFFSTDTGKDMYGLMTGEKDLADYTMALAGKADEMTWKRIWAAVELETAELHPDLQKGSEKFYEVCGKRFDEIIDRTQVVDSTLHRSQALRSPDGFTKMAYSFMSEPLKTYNLLRSAAVDAISAKDAASKKILTRTIVVCAVSSIFLACVTGAFDTLTGDDEEKLLKNFADNLTGDSLGMLPYVKDIYSVVRGFTVERMDMQGLSDAINAIMLIPKENYTWRYKVAQLAAKFAELGGVPVGSFKKSVYDLVLKNIFRGTDNFLAPYNMTKQMYYVDGGKKGEFINILFDAYSAGNKKHYNKILKDMIKEGLDAKTIESGLNSRFKKSGIKETFDVPWTKPYSITTEEDENKFGIKDLSASQYQSYQSQVTSLEKDIIGDLNRLRRGLSEDEYQKRLKAAYEYSTETALEKVAREKYESDKPWINKAQIAEEKYGLDPAEFIMFYKYFSELTPPAGREKFKTNEKKNLIIAYLNGMELTREEWNYLYKEVARYKK